MNGWIRTLNPEPVASHDADGAIEEVRRAIEVERRVVASPSELRIDEVEALDPEQGLWQLRVSLPRAARLENWGGAFLWRDLTMGGALWTADVLEADLRRGRLVIETGGTDAPEVGLVKARPFDFLRAPWSLLTSEGLRPALPAYGALLGAALGVSRGSVGLRRGWRGPAAWDHSLAMVWGPPGTGKTTTLVEQVARILQDPDERVLVVSTTHRATDEVALRLGPKARGVLRIGATDARPYRRAGLQHLLPRPRELWEALEEAQERLARARSPLARAMAHRAVATLRRGLPTLSKLLDEDQPRCAVATVHAALRAVVSEELRPYLEHRRAPFTTVVVDEAGLVPRATAAALGLLAAHQLVLVGDPRQLSPICVAARSLEPRVKRWLAVSAMDHAAAGQPATQALTTQHRMHPQVRRLVSELQYDGLLEDGPGVRDRPWAGGGRLEALPRAVHVVLDRCEGFDAASINAERGDARTWRRPAGIEIFERLLQRYPELQTRQGLFISPYRGQAEAAAALLERLAPTPWQASTVHAQQGTEAEVVVFDPVSYGGWQVAEWKRLCNVAFSRARQLLLLLAADTEVGGQSWLRAVQPTLHRFTVDARGRLLRELAPDAQGGLFAVPEEATAPMQAAEVVAPWQGGDPASLGVQILSSRAARCSLTRVQSLLVHRNLRDLGPRLVRGVAGSGKTIVLARWVAGELATMDRDATVVFGNTALEPQLRHLIDQAWRITRQDGSSTPWERVHLLHVGTLLRDLEGEAGLGRAPEPFDYDARARPLLAAELPPRFEVLYIDEAQDLGHDALRLLLSLVVRAEGEVPVRVFYDNAQNVYARSTPKWAELGLDMRGRSTVLRESFRSTRPAMEFALNVVHALRPFDDDPDMKELISPRSGSPLLVLEPGRGWRADFCVTQGQAPEVALHDSYEAELRALVARVEEWRGEGVRPRDIRVLAPNRLRCEAATEALARAGIPVVFARNRDFQPEDPRVLVTTPQSFKGYEAELIAVIGLDAFCPVGREPLVEALYVALTRSRTLMWASGMRVGVGHRGHGIIAAVEQAVALGGLSLPDD